MMNMQKLMRSMVLCGTVILLVPAVRAMTAAELARLRQEGAMVRLIDVRSSSRFKMGSIPGAMSVPSAVLLEKNFAPLGRVVLFSDGLGDIDMNRYLEALNQRPGVQAEALEGGYAAWLDEGQVTTAPTGMRRAKPSMISYAKLETLQVPVIVVDLRGPGRGRLDKVAPADKSRGGQLAIVDRKSLAEPDLVKEFCKGAGREFCSDLVELRRGFAKKSVARSGGAPA